MKTAIQTLRPEAAVPDAIAEALAALRATEAKATEAASALARVDAALTRARGHVAECAAAHARLDSLRDERRTLVADSLMDAGDVALIEANTLAITEAEAFVQELERLASDARGAIEALEDRYTEAAATVREAQIATHAGNYRLLSAMSEPMLAEYARRIESALDAYAELSVLVGRINERARQANMPLIPDAQGLLDFPAYPLGEGWRLRNVAGLVPNEMAAARARLADKLREMGVT